MQILARSQTPFASFVSFVVPLLIQIRIGTTKDARDAKNGLTKMSTMPKTSKIDEKGHK